MANQHPAPSILDAFILSDEQRVAALARGQDVVVTAGAGTGKTRTLVARFLALLDDGLPLRGIVAVTFTRKAAREMRNRVRAQIAAYLTRGDLDETTAARWQDLYNELDAARIGTIHNLCAEILRTHPAEARIDPRFDVLDESRSALLIHDAVEATLGWAVDQPQMAPLFALLRERQLQDLIGSLLKQRSAVAALIATLPSETIRDHWQAQLTAMQAEALSRLLADPDWLAAQQTLRENEPVHPEDKAAQQVALAFAALDTAAGEPAAGQIRNLDLLCAINLQGGSQKNWPGGKEQLAEVKAALKTLRDLWKLRREILTAELNAQDDAIAAAMPAIYALVAAATANYDAYKAELEALDFDDLETGAIALLATHPDVAAYWQGQVRALLVDEFQDTNESQRRLVRLLCPTPGKLFIVGDAKQSIYRFRGADVAVFDSAKDQIAEQGGLLVDLDISYRAHAQLLAGMNHLLRPVLGDDSATLPAWVAPFAPLGAGQDEVLDGLEPPFISCHLSVGNKGDALPVAAAALVDELERLHAENAIDYGQVAILCRASSAFQVYEDALDAAGVPYVTVAGKGFYERPEIRDLLNALTAVADPHDDLALVGLLRSPACGLSDETLYRLVRPRAQKGPSLWALLLAGQTVDDAAEAERLRQAVALVTDLNGQSGRISVADVLKQFLDRTHYRAILRRAGQPRALRNVSKLLLDIHTSELVSISRFLEYAQTLRDSGSREGEARATGSGAVQIMSIHAAKGLEFPVVILGDAAYSSGSRSPILIDPVLGILLPQKDEDKTQATGYMMAKMRDEERDTAEANRLLYVALTRAEQLLLLNGQVTQTTTGKLSARGWLKQLAGIIPLLDFDTSVYDAGGSNTHVLDLALQSTPIRAVYYEPAYLPTTAAAPSEPTEPFSPATDASPLLAPLTVIAAARPDGDDTPPRIWQVVAAVQRRRAPAWVIGKIVHEALALWRFPDAGFGRWATARAREYGLTDEQQLRHADREATKLLQRFRAQPLFREMDVAKPLWHEVAYCYSVNGQTETGYIDALYRHNGQWVLVDFKTDYLARGETPDQLLARTDYEAQVQRYGAAVHQMLGSTPRLLLCFLGDSDGEQVRAIPMGDAAARGIS